ncbi:hypothetical protein B0H13DRAFT_179221 [Mycena leptocephala]|nr:hypothetical protein B0H13DRAFT_179221 [Mycena leptocephala]
MRVRVRVTAGAGGEIGCHGIPKSTRNPSWNPRVQEAVSPKVYLSSRSRTTAPSVSTLPLRTFEKDLSKTNGWGHQFAPRRTIQRCGTIGPRSFWTAWKIRVLFDTRDLTDARLRRQCAHRADLDPLGWDPGLRYERCRHPGRRQCRPSALSVTGASEQIQRGTLQINTYPLPSPPPSALGGARSRQERAERGPICGMYETPLAPAVCRGRGEEKQAEEKMRKRTMTRRVIMRALTHGEDRVLADIPVQSFAMSVDLGSRGRDPGARVARKGR